MVPNVASKQALEAVESRFAAWRTILGWLGVGLVLGAVVSYFFFGRRAAIDPLATEAQVPPAEYLYLDSSRVLAYLSQLENGLPSNVQRTLSSSYGVSVSAKGGAAEAQGTRQAQTSLQETVTPTAASQFYALEAKLEEAHWLKSLDASGQGIAGRTDFATRFSRVAEGQFVKIANCRLVLPAFAEIYPLVKKRLPPLPLTLEVSTYRGRYDLLFPISYPALANETSLFSTNLTVVGKVIRQVPARSQFGPSYEPVSYVDTASDALFERILISRGRQLKQLGYDVEGLRTEFKVATTVRGPGAVILPIAILK